MFKHSSLLSLSSVPPALYLIIPGTILPHFQLTVESTGRAPVAANVDFHLFSPHFHGYLHLFYLAVNAEHEQHGEEEYCPQRGDGQLCHCLWVSQECQSRAWGRNRRHNINGEGWAGSAPAGLWGWLWTQPLSRDLSSSVTTRH